MFTSSVSRACGEEDVVIDPLELLGKRMDFQIRIVRCLGAKWLKEDAERGIQLGYQRPAPQSRRAQATRLWAPWEGLFPRVLKMSLS